MAIWQEGGLNVNGWLKAGCARLLRPKLAIRVAIPVRARILREIRPVALIAATMVIPSNRNEKAASNGCADGQMKLNAMALLPTVNARKKLKTVTKPRVQIGAGWDLLVGSVGGTGRICSVGACGLTATVAGCIAGPALGRVCG